MLRKIRFQNCDPNDSQKTPLCIIQVKKHWYATHRKDVGKNSTPIWIRLQSDAKLQTQRRTKILIHYGEKLNAFSDYLQKNEKIKQIVSTRQEKAKYRTIFLNQKLFGKNDSIRIEC